MKSQVCFKVIGCIFTLFSLSINSIAQEKKPNIIFIIVDQWRASAFGYAGDPNANTPNLDKLEKESIHFQNSVSVMPVCTPFRAALMTARYPTSTGMFLNDLHLPMDENVLGDVLVDKGYNTAFIGKWHLDGHGRKAFIPKERRRGFQYWKAGECDHDYNNSHYYTGDSDEKMIWEGYDTYAQTQDAQQYLRDNAENNKPFALVISYGTPHFPHHTAPEELKQKYPLEKIVLPKNVPESMVENAKIEAQGYYAHSEALDTSIGELLATLDELGISDNTLILFTSDHGEMLGAHGVRPKAKQVPFAESARTPLLIRYPALHGNSGKRISTPITTPDLLPTVFGMLGISAPDSFEGEDLSEIIIKGEEIPDRAVLYMIVAPFSGVEHYGKEYRAIKTSRYSYVKSLSGPWMLFDDQADPLQLNNLVDNPNYADLLSKMDRKLGELLQKTGDDFKPAQWYLDHWNLVPASHGSIPYDNEGTFPPQTPSRKSL
jgi:arylsulfatase A-like enzyme